MTAKTYKTRKGYFVLSPANYMHECTDSTSPTTLCGVRITPEWTSTRTGYYSAMCKKCRLKGDWG